MLAPAIHGSDEILSWTIAPSVLIGFGLWTLAYVYLTGHMRKRRNWGAPPSRGQQTAFHSATLIAVLALISPIDHIGDEYLFSAHMLQHLLLMFVSAPLWLAGMPSWLMQALVLERIETPAYWLTRPLIAFLIFSAAMSVWHVPFLYNLAFEHEWIHITEHLMYMAAAVIGWWPIAGPDVEFAPRPAPPARMLYIFLLAMPCTALASFLTFAKAPLYPFYVSAPRILPLSVMADQQLGGLLMWLPTHMILLLAFSITFFRWFNALGKDKKEASPINATL
jgi:putative membrane protein